jgi:hypothetical protein
MSQPESKKNEPSKMKKLLNGGEADESPMARLQRSMGGNISQKKETASKADIPKQPKTVSKPAFQPKAASKANTGGFKFMPAFWTVASVMSFTVNIVLLIVLAIVLQNLGTVGVTVMGLSDHLLGGLYNNFVKMDEAHIKTNIPVSKEIPVQFTLNVSGPTSVTLSQDVAISGAFVTVNTGGLNINKARADIILPEGTVLPIYIQNLVVPVDQKVLAELDVAVDIPLNQTELHAPFVGLRKVVEPFYCLLNDCP